MLMKTHSRFYKLLVIILIIFFTSCTGSYDDSVINEKKDNEIDVGKLPMSRENRMEWPHNIVPWVNFWVAFTASGYTLFGVKRYITNSRKKAERKHEMIKDLLRHFYKSYFKIIELQNLSYTFNPEHHSKLKFQWLQSLGEDLIENSFEDTPDLYLGAHRLSCELRNYNLLALYAGENYESSTYKNKYQISSDLLRRNNEIRVKLLSLFTLSKKSIFRKKATIEKELCDYLEYAFEDDQYMLELFRQDFSTSKSKIEEEKEKREIQRIFLIEYKLTKVLYLFFKTSIGAYRPRLCMND